MAADMKRVEAAAKVLREAIFSRGERWHQAAQSLLDADDAYIGYEYGIQYFDTKDKAWYVIGEWFGYGVAGYWGTRSEREVYLDDLRTDYVTSTFELVKRRKAGRIEDV